MNSAVRIAGRPLRFVAAGAANTAFGLAIYPALRLASPWLHDHYLAALVAAQATSLLFAFATYKLGVFRTRAGVAGEFARFCAFHLANYAINWLALPLLVEGLRLDPSLAQVGYALAGMAASYLWHSRVTFAPTISRTAA